MWNAIWLTILHVSPSQGVSDAIIYFFCADSFAMKQMLRYLVPSTTLCIHRQLLPKRATEFVAGALAYKAIVYVCTSGSELKRKFFNTNDRSTMDTCHPLLLFPCKPDLNLYPVTHVHFIVEHRAHYHMNRRLQNYSLSTHKHIHSLLSPNASHT